MANIMGLLWHEDHYCKQNRTNKQCVIILTNRRRDSCLNGRAKWTCGKGWLSQRIVPVSQWDRYCVRESFPVTFSPELCYKTRTQEKENHQRPAKKPLLEMNATSKWTHPKDSISSA